MMAISLKMGITAFLAEAGVGRATMMRYKYDTNPADAGVYYKLLAAYERLKARRA